MLVLWVAVVGFAKNIQQKRLCGEGGGVVGPAMERRVLGTSAHLTVIPTTLPNHEISTRKSVTGVETGDDYVPRGPE